MREEERQAQRAAARAERRTRRAAEQAAQNVPQKTEAPKAPQKAGVPHKKKKINKFRVAVVCTAAVLVALVALGVASAAGVRTPISSIAADGEPEFFSTVKPQASAAPAESTASAAPTPSSAFDGALFIGDSMTTCPEKLRRGRCRQHHRFERCGIHDPQRLFVGRSAGRVKRR